MTKPSMIKEKCCCHELSVGMPSATRLAKHKKQRPSLFSATGTEQVSSSDVAAENDFKENVMVLVWARSGHVRKYAPFCHDFRKSYFVPTISRDLMRCPPASLAGPPIRRICGAVIKSTNATRTAQHMINRKNWCYPYYAGNSNA